MSLCPISNNFEEVFTEVVKRNQERDRLVAGMKDDVSFNKAHPKLMACDGRYHYSFYPDGREYVQAKRNFNEFSPELVLCPDYSNDDTDNAMRIELNQYLDQIPITMREKELDQLQGLDPERERALSFIESSARIMVLLGETGRGKTHFSVGVGKEFIRSGKTAYFITASGEAEGLFPVFKEMTNRNAAEGMDFSMREIWLKMKHSNCVIIDDLGGDRPQSWGIMQSGLLELLDKAEGKIIFTTNLKPDEIQTRYGERIKSRIFEAALILPIGGFDHRRQRRGEE